MATYIIGGALLVFCTFVLYRYIRKLRRGDSCCTTGETPEKKIHVKDRNVANYPCTATLRIDGMTCAKCAIRIENALNAMSDHWATVNLGKKSALVRSKQTIDAEAIRKAVRDCGYTVLEIELL